MINVQSSRFVPIFRSAVCGLVATVALFSTTNSGFAGTREADAVRAALPAGVTYVTATAAQLAAAVNAAAGTKPKGVFLGEALRNAAQDVGAGLASVAGTDPTIASVAIKTTGSGKAPNLTNVPKFAQAFTGGDKVKSISLAEAVRSSKAGAGAVLGGYALGAAVTDADRLTLLNSNRKLLPAVQQIAQFVGATALNPVTFANLGATADSKNAVKIVVGTSAGNPTRAGEIVQGSKSLVASKAALFAKGVGAVIDIEQVQKVGEALASVVTKSSALLQVTAALGKAIASKPTTMLGSLTDTTVDGSGNPNDPSYRNRLSNKVDEFGELAAYSLNAAKGLADFADAKKGSKLAFGIISSIVKSAKLSLAQAKKAGTPAPDLSAVLSYVYGSVVLTLKGLAAVPPVGAGVTQALTDLNTVKNLKGLAGLDGKAGLTESTLTALFSAATLAGTRFENGTVLLTNGAGGVGLTDPETNTRSF